MAGGLGLLGWSVEVRCGNRAWLRAVSVFFREHHCEDARRDRRIGGVRRHQLHVCVVVVDFPKAAHIAVLDETEVVLTVRVVVLVELMERLNLAEYQAALLCWQRFKTRSGYYRAADKRAAEGIVERANAIARERVFSGHFFPRESCGKSADPRGQQ